MHQIEPSGLRIPAAAGASDVLSRSEVLDVIRMPRRVLWSLQIVLRYAWSVIVTNSQQKNISLVSATLIFFSAAMVLCNYYYLYFVQFREGLSEGGVAYSVFKLAGVLCACISLLTPKLKTSYWAAEFLLILFLFSAVVIFSIKSALTGLGDVMFVNALICMTPFIVLKPRRDLTRFVVFFDSCLFIIFLQVVVDFFLYYSDRSIWENKAFIGGMGNPSSFGLLCNLMIAYVLFFRQGKLSVIWCFPVLVAGVYMTSSLLSLLVLGYIIFVWAFINISVKKIAVSVVFMLVAAFLSTYLISDHLLYKLQSAANIFNAGAESDGSRSVSLRMEIHETYLRNFERSPVEAFVSGFHESSYMQYDSQVLTYLSSFGVICFSLFFGFFVIVLIRSYRSGLIFQAVGLSVLGLTLLTNRILDYYPIPLFLVLLVIMSKSARVGAGGLHATQL